MNSKCFQRPTRRSVQRSHLGKILNREIKQLLYRLSRCLFELNNGKCGLTDASRRAFRKAIFFLFDICEGMKKASETMLRGRHQRQKAKRLRGNLTLCYKTSFSILRFSPPVHSQLGWEINNLWDNEAKNIDFLLIMEQICTFLVPSIRFLCTHQAKFTYKESITAKRACSALFRHSDATRKQCECKKQNIWGGKAFPLDW